MHHTDKYSQHSSIIWLVWLKGWVFIYELSGCEFESSCSHLKNFRFCTCFEQGVPWHSGYGVWIHSDTCMWHDKNIQLDYTWYKKIENFQALKKKPAVSLAKFIIYKIVYVIIHFAIIIVSNLALIRLLFVELGFHQIKRRYMIYYSTTIPIYSKSYALIDWYCGCNLSWK